MDLLFVPGNRLDNATPPLNFRQQPRSKSAAVRHVAEYCPVERAAVGAGLGSGQGFDDH